MATGDAEDEAERLRARSGERGQKPRDKGQGASNATARPHPSQPEAEVRLMERIVSRENMMAAFSRVTGNKRAAGIDPDERRGPEAFSQGALAAYQRRSAGRAVPAAAGTRGGNPQGTVRLAAPGLFVSAFARSACAAAGCVSWASQRRLTGSSSRRCIRC